MDNISLHTINHHDSPLARLAKTLFDTGQKAVINNYTHESNAAREYLEGQAIAMRGPEMQQLLEEIHLISPGDDEHTTDALLQLCQMVGESIRELQGEQLSIDDVVDGVAKRTGVDPDLLSSSESGLENKLRQAVFALIGRITGLYTASTGLYSSQLVVGGYGKGTATITPGKITLAGRPLPLMLRSMGVMLPTPQPQLTGGGPTGADDVHIAVDTVNISSLSLKVEGRHITVEWIDDLRGHLDFDEDTRTLYLFRYPSLCALYYTKAEVASFFDLVLNVKEQNASSSQFIRRNATFHREVLLSFRVLFGQVKASRRIYNRVERRHAASRHNERVDPLLDTLCGTRTDLETLMTEGGVRERAIYDNVHFPSLGPRLARLQRFVESHRITKIRDRWRDRSNRSEWMAFWVLLGVGAFSIVLSIVQTGLAAAQLKAQYDSNAGGDTS